jgi:hypothetical protein
VTIEEWDSHWQKVYDRAVSRGKTPNQAIVVAYANTEKSLGDRPVEVRK